MLANAPPQGKGCGPPGPNPFPHRSLMHRRNASPHRFLVRSSKPLQSAFPFPQEERQPSQIPRAQIQTPSERISVPARGTPALTDSSCADPTPFRAHFRSRRRNIRPSPFLLRGKRRTAQETQICAGNAELRGKRGTACSEILNLSTGTGQRSVPCSKKTVLSTGTSKNRCGRLEACGKPEGRL